MFSMMYVYLTWFQIRATEVVHAIREEKLEKLELYSTKHKKMQYFNMLKVALKLLFFIFNNILRNLLRLYFEVSENLIFYIKLPALIFK